jgi:hypothetical protein
MADSRREGFMKFQKHLILFTVIALLISACSSLSDLVIGGAAAPASQETTAANARVPFCRVTQPPEPPFIPPDPWPAEPPATDRFWYGDRGLWTALPNDGSWPQLAIGEKFFWWSNKFDVSEDETPDLRVTARRLDGDSTPFQVSEATNAYHESFNLAMLIGVELPSPGCWEFSGQYKDHQLSFILWVPEE